MHETSGYESLCLMRVTRKTRICRVCPETHAAFDEALDQRHRLGLFRTAFRIRAG